MIENDLSEHAPSRPKLGIPKACCLVSGVSKPPKMGNFTDFTDLRILPPPSPSCRVAGVARTAVGIL